MSRRKQNKPRAMRELDDDPPIKPEVTSPAAHITETNEHIAEIADAVPTSPEVSRDEERTKLALEELKQELRKSRDSRSDSKGKGEPVRRTRSSSRKGGEIQDLQNGEIKERKNEKDKPRTAEKKTEVLTVKLEKLSESKPEKKIPEVDEKIAETEKNVEEGIEEVKEEEVAKEDKEADEEEDEKEETKAEEADLNLQLEEESFSGSEKSNLDDITTSPPKTLSLQPPIDSMTILNEDTATNPDLGNTGTEISASAAQSAASALGDTKEDVYAFIDEPNKNKKHEYAKILPISLESGDHAYLCPICNEALEDSHSLTVHIRNHNSKVGQNVPSSHSCTICGKTLCSQSSLDRHMLVHSGERPFRCQVCDLSFTTNGNMHRHMRVHEKEFSKSPGSLKALLDASLQPIHGGDRRSRKRRSTGVTDAEKRQKLSEHVTSRDLGASDHVMTSVTDHVMSVTDAMRKKMMATTVTPTMADKPVFREDSKPEDGEKLSCPACDKTFLCRSGLDAHIESTHPDCNIKCQLCHLSFPSTSLLTAHHAVIHGNAFVNGLAPPLGFHEPPIGFHELASFTDFSAGKFPMIAKRWCEENARRASSQFHKFDCLICKKAFPTPDSLDLHMKSHANPEAICDICQLIMPDQASLKKHKQAAHASRVLNFDEPKEEIKERFLGMMGLHQDKEDKPSESSSEESTSNVDYFKKLAEMNKPSSSEKVRRSEENNNSSDFADIQKIIQNANCSALPPLSATPTTAPKFQDLFRRSAPAAPADESEDEGVPLDYLYDEMSDSMSDSSDMNNGATPSKFTCKLCEEQFDHINALKVHMRTHQGLSPFKCNMCPYSSPDKTTLIRHLRTHNGERPFQCKLCLYAFTTKANCERHVKKKHNKETKEEIDLLVGYNDQLEDAVTPDSTDLQQQHSPQSTVCKYCGRDFHFYRALKHHLRSHSNCRMKPFACTICDIGFSTKANCIRHVQKRHPEVDPSQWEAHVKYNARDGFDLNQQRDVTQNQSPVSQEVLAKLAKLSAAKIMQESAAPLDFSKKALLESPSAILENVQKDQRSEADDEVLDLSKPSQEKVSKPVSLIPSKPSIHPAFSMLPFMNPALNPEMMLKQQREALQVAANATSHHAKSSSTKFKCPFCHLQFHQESKLHLHMNMHATSRPFQCNYCPAGFTVKSNLDIHVRTRHDNGGSSSSSQSSFTPSRNRFVSPSLKLLQQSSKLPLRPSPYSLMTPGKYPAMSGSALANLDLAMMKQHNDSELASVSKLLLSAAKQDTLKSLMAARAEIEKPMMTSQPSSMTSQSPKMSVDDDDKEVVVMDDGQRVEIKKEGNRSREDYSSGGDSPDKSLLRKKRNSYANAPNRVSCPYCSRTFPWISSLRRHILTHTGQKPYKCPDCPVHFSTKSNRERHLLRKHGINPANPNNRQIMDRPYKCQLCVFSSFSKPEKLIHHYKTKHPEADIPTNIHEMNVEMWLTSPNRPVLMDETEDGALVINEDEEDDSEEEELMMDEEEEEMMTPDMMHMTPDMMHMTPRLLTPRDSDGDEEADDEDNDVDDSSLRMTPEPGRKGLDVYSPGSDATKPSPIRTTIINPERDNYNVDKILDCWLCGAHYGTRKLLLRHLKEHNTDLPFKCYLCDASYTTRKACLDHKVERHPDDWVMLRARNKVENIDEFVVTMERLTEVADEEGANNARIKEVRIGNSDETTIMAAERKVFCALCPKKFWSLQDLRRHMRSHTGEKPFECDICGRYFTLKHSMMRHRRKHTEADYKPYKVTPGRHSFIPDGSLAAGSESNDEDMTSSVRSSLGTPVPDHQQFLAIRERMSRTASPVTMAPLPAPASVSAPPASPLVKEAPAPAPRVGAASAAVGGIASMASLLGDSDILHNLLGVDNSAIDQMLTSSSVDAAKLLGMD